MVGGFALPKMSDKPSQVNWVIPRRSIRPSTMASNESFESAATGGRQSFGAAGNPMSRLSRIGGRKGLRPSRCTGSIIGSRKPRFIGRSLIEAFGHQLWLAMTPRSGPSACSSLREERDRWAIDEVHYTVHRNLLIPPTFRLPNHKVHSNRTHGLEGSRLSAWLAGIVMLLVL